MVRQFVLCFKRNLDEAVELFPLLYNLSFRVNLCNSVGPLRGRGGLGVGRRPALG